MNDMQDASAIHDPIKLREGPPDLDPAQPSPPPVRRPARRVLTKGSLFAAAVLILLVGGLAIGYLHHADVNQQVKATADQLRDFVPSVRTAAVHASGETMSVIWPGTAEAFEQTNIYARASGYVSRRDVDIGSRVKAGQLLVEITAPELDHQIAQAEATLAQMQASLEQAKANRDLGQVTWNRNNPLVQKGWVTSQQGDTDRLNLQAQTAGVGVASANITAQEAQLRVLGQQKAYQRVVAPFDGVITQRNVDIGNLVQADASSATFLFTLMQSDTIRIELNVPQNEAFGIHPGVEAVVRVPEMPGRDFHGVVARIAEALQPGTRTLRTEVDVPNPDHELSPGTYCTVELKIPRKTPSLIVPSEAIIFNRDGLSVAVVENGVARIRALTVVRDFGTNVEVSAGVKEGDEVVLNPPVDLVDGRALKIRPSPAVKPS
jgi:RND family efflux transporter MFP subunit